MDAVLVINPMEDVMKTTMEVLVDKFEHHVCMGKYGCIASFDKHQWDAILHCAAKEIITAAAENRCSVQDAVEFFAAEKDE